MQHNQPCPNPKRNCNSNFRCVKDEHTKDGNPMQTSAYKCRCGCEWTVYTYVCVTKQGSYR